MPLAAAPALVAAAVVGARPRRAAGRAVLPRRRAAAALLAGGRLLFHWLLLLSGLNHGGKRLGRLQRRGDRQVGMLPPVQSLACLCRLAARRCHLRGGGQRGRGDWRGRLECWGRGVWPAPLGGRMLRSLWAQEAAAHELHVAAGPQPTLSKSWPWAVKA